MDKMLSPDELDELMRVTDPRGWLALIALLALVIAAVGWSIFASVPVEVGGDQGVLIHSGARHGVASQVSGLVTQVEVKPKDQVKEGQVIARVQTDSGEKADVVTLYSGRAEEVLVQKGMVLNRGQQVAVVEQGSKPLEAVIFAPTEQGKQLEKGMRVQISPTTAKVEEYGFMEGRVTSVSEFPVTRGEMFAVLANQSLVDTLRTDEDQLQVDVKLQSDPSTPSGFSWSSSKGPPFSISHGTPVTATFVLGKQHPINLVFPSSNE
jgi:multidrug efflux pump subunit AcrA (membrane-fusion protein)